MYLVQLLLPLYSNAGNKFPQEFYAHMRDELVDRFGGITAYTRAPVRGLWQEIEGQTVRDDLIISTKSWSSVWTESGGVSTERL